MGLENGFELDFFSGSNNMSTSGSLTSAVNNLPLSISKESFLSSVSSFQVEEVENKLVQNGEGSSFSFISLSFFLLDLDLFLLKLAEGICPPKLPPKGFMRLRAFLALDWKGVDLWYRLYNSARFQMMTVTLSGEPDSIARFTNSSAIQSLSFPSCMD